MQTNVRFFIDKQVFGYYYNAKQMFGEVNIMKYTSVYNEHRTRRVSKMRRNSFKKNLIRVCAIVLIFTAAVAAVIIMSCNAVRTHASVSGANKYYRSVTIMPGDTLWSIAEEYMDPMQYTDARDYIKELRQINSLDSDSIKSGCHIIVTCYSYD